MNQFETPPGIPHGLTRDTTLRRSGHLGAALSIALLLPLASACGDSTRLPTDRAGNANIELQIAPLNLEQIGYACYDITVYAITDPITLAFTPVWSRGNYFQPHRTAGAPSTVVDADTLCSNLFGNGPQGDIFYIGTCDATYPTHVVELVIDGLYKPLGDPLTEGSDWNNPCTASNPCQFYAECRENADTPVVISLTILRSANQGFFDIAVRFDDIFCSAKVDCEYGDNGDNGGRRSAATSWTPINLVHNSDGEPSTTAVIGFACTAGPGVKDETELYLNAPRIECGYGDVRAATQTGTMCHDGGEL